MDISILIKTWTGLCLIIAAPIVFSNTTRLCAQVPEKTKTTKVNTQTYLSAFTSPGSTLHTEPPLEDQDSGLYTIQLFTSIHYSEDHFFQGKYKIKSIRMGELYRYIFSRYTRLIDARRDLELVRQYYPQAYIRHYKHGKLGLAIDMNIEPPDK